MGRISYVPFSGTITSANGDVDLAEVIPADDKPCRARGFCVGQVGEIAEAQEEDLDIRLVRLTGTVTGGSGGSAGAPFSADSADATSYASETMNTTVATQSGGAQHDLAYPWNLRSTPLEVWFPDDRFALKAKQTEGLFLRLATAVTDDVAVKGWLCVEEE